MEWWEDGVNWSIGVLEYWSVGVLEYCECWSLRIFTRASPSGASAF